MLCPEVWNFEPPPSSTRYKLVENDREINNVVNGQYFNHFVSLTIPDAIQVYPSLRDALIDDSEFYHVSNLFAFELVKYEFVDLFVKNGRLTLISVGTHLDEDDCLVITPTKNLVFSLRRKAFQELGLEGKPSSFSNKTPDKYVVTVDLTSSSMVPGKKYYKRVLERLQNKKDLCFNVILFWEPHSPQICPSSIASFLSNLGYKVRTCSVNLKQRTEYNVSVPIFDSEFDAEMLTEWLGAFNLRCSIPHKADGFLTTYECQENCTEFGQTVYLEAVGLFTVTRIKRLIQEIQNYVTLKVPTSWIGLHVQGFEDSVVNRGDQEHFFYACGDYHYTIFFRHEKPSLLCVHTSSTRRPNTKSRKKKRRKR